jgi:hypothetical protein
MEGESRNDQFTNMTDCISSLETLIITCRKVPLQVPVSGVKINGWYKLIDWNIHLRIRIREQRLRHSFVLEEKRRYGYNDSYRNVSSALSLQNKVCNYI